MNERESLRDGLTLCRACTGNAYYQTGNATQILFDELRSRQNIET
jgi:hypothetical protein